VTRRRALWVSGIATLALFVVLAVLDKRMSSTGGPGIVGFELAGGEHRAQEILSQWGGKGHDAARLSLWLDYAYIASYVALLTLAVAATRDAAARRGWVRLAAIGGVVIAAPILAGLCDAVENAGLLLALGRHGGNTAPLLATVFASVKFVLTGMTLLYLLAGIVARIRSGPHTAADPAPGG
jgi:hypothetical protein